MAASCRRQRGAALVLGAAALAMALACLMVLDVAHVFTVKRELQKVADLAALAGANLPGDCAAMQGRAQASAAANGHVQGTGGNDAKFECGAWTPAGGFAAAGASGPSALRATASRSVPYFFLFAGSRTVQAQAVARNDAYDVFSLGTGLASVNAGALNALLSAILGSKVDLQLASYQGLANAQLRLGDLVDVDTLNVGTVQELLDANVRLSDLTLAMAQALQGGNVLQASVLQALALQVPGNLDLKLSDLLDVQLPSTEAAADVKLNVLDLLLAAAQVSNGSRLLDLSASVPSNALASVDLKLQVVEAPRIAIGVEGTQAHSAQVRLLLNTRLLSLTLPAGLLATSGLQLPLYVEAAPGTATLQRMQCAPDVADCAVEFNVQPGIARACIGTDAMSASPDTTGCTAPAHLLAVDVNLLGLKVASIDLQARADVQIADTAGQTVRFGSGGFAGSQVNDSYYEASTSVGSSVAQLLVGLPSNLQLDPHISLLGIDLGLLDGLVAGLLQTVLNAVSALTSSVLQPLLVNLVGPLLETLGVRAGIADLHQIALHCSHAELVQ